LIYLNNTLLPGIREDIINRINASLQVNYNAIITLQTKLRQLKEFNEESIYLITDSMVQSQQEAMKAFSTGDVSTTVEKMEQTQQLLGNFEEKLLELKSTKTEEIQNGAMTAEIKSTGLLASIMSWFSNLFTGIWH